MKFSVDLGLLSGNAVYCCEHILLCKYSKRCWNSERETGADPEGLDGDTGADPEGLDGETGADPEGLDRDSGADPEGLDGDSGADPEGLDRDSGACLLYTSPSPRDRQKSRMPSSA